MKHKDHHIAKQLSSDTPVHASASAHSPSQFMKDRSLLVFLGALCFSGSGTIQAFAPDGATPFVIGALRLLVAGIFLVLWCMGKKSLRPLKEYRLSKFFFSACALAAFQITFFMGVREAGVAVGTVVTIGMTPVMSAVFGLVFHGEIPRKNWYLSTFIAIVGLFLLNLQDMETFHVKNLLFPVIAGTIYAFYLSQSKELVRSNSPELVMAWLFLFSSFMLLPLWFLFPCAWVFTLRGIIVALALGILTTALAYCLVMAGLRNCDTAKAATLSLGEPLGAAILGFSVLQEPLGLIRFIGVLMIFVSVLVLIYMPAQAKTKKI